MIHKRNRPKVRQAIRMYLDQEEYAPARIAEAVGKPYATVITWIDRFEMCRELPDEEINGALWREFGFRMKNRREI